MKHFRLLAAVALSTALVAAPLAAHADTSVGTCEVGLVLPSRLAITGWPTSYGARVVGEQGCYYRVAWDVSQGLISTGRSIYFYKPASSGFQTWVGDPATVRALPAPGATSLDRFVDPTTGTSVPVRVIETASNPMTVKYDSRIAWRTPQRDRTGRVLLRASVASISKSTVVFGRYATWSGAKIRFQHKERGTWRTVAVARTDRKGNAQLKTRLLRGEWRVQSVDTATTWGRASGSHRL